MKVPKDYVLDMVIDYEDYVEFYYKNNLGDIKIYVEYKKKGK